MRVTSGRAATAALLLVGLAVLALASRLLPSTPSAQRPATTAATLAPAIRTAPGNTRGYGVPDVLGHTLAQAERIIEIQGKVSELLGIPLDPASDDEQSAT